MFSYRTISPEPESFALYNIGVVELEDTQQVPKATELICCKNLQKTRQLRKSMSQFPHLPDLANMVFRNT